MSVSRRLALVGWVVFGIVSGSLLPLAEQSGRWFFVFLLAVVLGTGLLAGLEAEIEALRGRDFRWPVVPRATRWQLLPFDAGVVVGLTMSMAAGVGSDRQTTDSLLGIYGFAMGLSSMAIGVYIGAYGIRQWRDSQLSWAEAAGSLTISVGMVFGGIGLCLVSVRLLGADDHGMGVEGAPFFGGWACFLVGCVIVAVERRRLQS